MVAAWGAPGSPACAFSFAVLAWCLLLVVAAAASRLVYRHGQVMQMICLRQLHAALQHEELAVIWSGTNETVLLFIGFGSDGVLSSYLPLPQSFVTVLRQLAVHACDSCFPPQTVRFGLLLSRYRAFCHKQRVPYSCCCNMGKCVTAYTIMHCHMSPAWQLNHHVVLPQSGVPNQSCAAPALCGSVGSLSALHCSCSAKRS